jgi:hypothetical protein
MLIRNILALMRINPWIGANLEGEKGSDVIVAFHFMSI